MQLSGRRTQSSQQAEERLAIGLPDKGLGAMNQGLGCTIGGSLGGVELHFVVGSFFNQFDIFTFSMLMSCFLAPFGII